MADPTGPGFDPLPYGCRDIKLYPFAAGVAGATAVDLPRARTLQFTETEAFSDLRGDDALQATHGSGPTVDWTLEAGGVSFAALKVLYGHTLVQSGSTPNIAFTASASGTKQRPYFKLVGQAISDSGGDFQVVIYKAKCNGDLTGEMSDGNFWLTGAKGIGLPDADGDLYDFVQNETALTVATG